MQKAINIFGEALLILAGTWVLLVIFHALGMPHW
jgi:hypothetical protein